MSDRTGMSHQTEIGDRAETSDPTETGNPTETSDRTEMASPITRPDSSTAARAAPPLLKIIAVVMLGALMMQLDMTMTTIAPRTLAGAYPSRPAALQWVASGYLLAMASTLPLAGWALERFGARTVWMTSIGVFLAGSVLCGLAWSPGSLIVFRVLQGLGAGVVMPVGQAVLVRAAPPGQVGRGMAALGRPARVGPG